ncbi:MAG: VCBS repeat-containing protein [Candidatus Heimdallarchaeum aukensis]|uniref:VCBS repeat-containing protein n=1 Tax=Candidatus Heimdallarchaeum aukensis TaxID=2876573 RepID=A0A9Y1BNH9_9ARCH|nr:MAG: VCBS repeat-containing protein [Candidatus Heimdallarchaeum aukensis]
MKWKFKTGGSIRASPALGDLNNDGYLDIVIGSSDSYYYAFNGRTRTILWTLKTELIIGGTAPTLADVDGDNELDVLLNGKNVYLVGGRKGNLISIYNQNEEVGTSITVGDLDNDGSFEMIYGSKSGNVFCYTITNSDKTSYRIYWQGDGGDFFNSGNSFTIDKDGDTVSTFSEKIIGTDPEKRIRMEIFL